MYPTQFKELSKDLQSVYSIMPKKWGDIQNDKTDSKLNLFEVKTFQELESRIHLFPDKDKNYFRRRWFIWKCAQCDEYLFTTNHNVTQNPNHRDQEYDIMFNNNPDLRFDLKGTVIPKRFRENVSKLILDPLPMIQFFYEKQSSGVRSNVQNRLFIVHHSFKETERELFLRCQWAFKRRVYWAYSRRINRPLNFVKYENVYADVIFLFEQIDGSLTYRFAGRLNNDC